MGAALQPNFSSYWKKQEQKKRKSWASKAKRYAERHTGLEDIRKEVFMPLDYRPAFEYDSYKKAHFTRSNPIAVWEQGRFGFSETGLRKALEADGADLDSLRFELNQQSIVGKDAPQPQVTGYDPQWTPNKVYDLRDEYHKWLKRIYEVCTDVQTCKLTYGQVQMIIRRYTTDGLPFAYYELIPAEQMFRSAMLLQETEFYTLNVATLLLEMAAESKLRQEELNYYAKMLRLRSMEAATIDSIEFTRWDDKALEKKMKEYVGKEYTLGKIFEQVLRPWRLAVKKFFDAAADCSPQDEAETFEGFYARSSRWSRSFIEGVFCPYLKKEGMEKAGLEDVEVVIENELRMAIKSQGFNCSVESNSSGVFFYPNSDYKNCCIKLSLHTPLSAVAWYLRMMPVINREVDEVVVKVMHIYDRMVLQQKYHDDLVHLEDLMKESAGKPVGKLMKYLRWNLSRFASWSSISPQSFKILGDTAFSYIVKDFDFKRTSNGPHPFVAVEKDRVVERWIDAECHHIYASDPCVKDASKHDSRLHPIQEYLHISPVLSFDFIDQKL